MKNTWIRNQSLAVKAANYVDADEARNNLRFMRPRDFNNPDKMVKSIAGAIAVQFGVDQVPDESKRKVRVRKRPDGTFDVIVWERSPEAPKEKPAKRNKRFSPAEMGIPADSGQPETRGVPVRGKGR